MSENTNIKRKLGWLEAALFIGGFVLLAVYFQVRASNDGQRAEGIQAFLSASETGAAGAGSAQLLDSIAPPDQELWSDKRKSDYEASLKASTDLPLAVLTIDKLGIQVPVYNGADEFNLNRGVARIKGTGRIGTQGNLGIAGHRDGFFRALKDIVLDDPIQLQTSNGLENFRGIVHRYR